MHPEPIDTKPATTVTLAPEGCNGETFSYKITLTVTDGAGLSGTNTVTLYPDCGAASACAGTGSISRQKWNNVSGSFVTAIPLNTTPSSTQITLFETPSNSGDNYGQRVRGYVCPPQSGNYVFYIASDDKSELWLSTDENPANKRRIAYNNSGWTNSREWTKFSTQTSAPIALQSGRRYYIEALHKESVGGDNLAVGWKLPSGTLERPIPGSRLLPYSGATARTSSETELAEYTEEEEDFIKVYPNPFTSKTTIEFTLTEEDFVNASIYNTSGELVKQLFEGSCQPGAHLLEFEAGELNNGLYLARITTSRAVYYKKIVLLK